MDEDASRGPSGAAVSGTSNMPSRTADTLIVVGAAGRSARCGSTVKAVRTDTVGDTVDLARVASYAVGPANSASPWAVPERVC